MIRGVLLVLLAFLTFTVSAHPHSFIRLKTEVVSDNETIVALKMRWTMDELTSADLLYDAGDAKPGSEIWKNWRLKSWRMFWGSTTSAKCGTTDSASNLKTGRWNMA